MPWQLVLKASWAYDYSYFMISSLSIADRRHLEKDMLRFHLSELEAHGVGIETMSEQRTKARAVVIAGRVAGRDDMVH
ncbi:MAG: hypothetical protein ABSG30_03435 [Steroidobacteraceae bacterium]|jgi:hypothetical protein